MIAQEMHNEFKITLDKDDSSAYPEFLDGEIDFYLNEAQERFVKQRYDKNNIYRVGFEEKQKRTEDLKNLVKTKFTATTVVPYHTNEAVYRANISELFDDETRLNPASEEYMFYVKSFAYSCKPECCSWRRVKLVQQDDLSHVFEDPFNKPKAELPVVFFEDDDIFVSVDSLSTVNNFKLTFVKRPLLINLGTYGGTVQNCELSDHTHKEIVQMAVGIAIENIESPRTNSHQILNVNKSE